RRPRALPPHPHPAGRPAGPRGGGGGPPPSPLGAAPPARRAPPARPAQLKRRRRPPAPALLLDRRRPPQRLLRTQRPLRREQLLLRAPRAPPLLAADARPLGQSGVRHAARARLELVEQVAAREEAVQGLRALALALDHHAARPVAEHDTGGHLVDVLPALPARADEVLLQLVLAHAERPHARGERVLLLGRDGEHADRLTIRPVGWPPPRGPVTTSGTPAPTAPTPPARDRKSTRLNSS